MLIDIPTMFVVIITMSLTLSIAIGWVVQREGHDGLRPLIFGLALNAVAYTLFALRGQIPDFWSICVGNVTIVGCHSLLIFAIAEFQQRRVARLLLWSPVVVIAVAFGAFMSDIAIRVAISSAVFLVQDLVLLRLLLGDIRKIVGRGQHLIIVAIAINLLIMVYRAFIAFTEPHFIHHITDAGTSQTLVYLSAFVSLTLIAVGFVLMTKESADEKTRQMAMTDKLTACWNRFRIEEVAQQELARLQRYATPASLIMIDIDHFKPINDKFGHATGDAILQGFAATTRACIRNTDVLGRWGGEEFVVVLPASGFAAAADTAERIRRAVEAAEYFGGITITASLGISSCQSTDSWNDWLQRADTALYQAKARGRNRVEAEMPLQSPENCRQTGTGAPEAVWHPDYEMGCRVIDTQHRLLFERGSQLIEAMTQGVPKDEVNGKIAEFVALAEDHFRDEEAILAVGEFPDLAAHREQHHQLIERATTLIERHQRGQLETPELLNFVVYELTAQHLLGEDRKFRRYVQDSR